VSSNVRERDPLVEQYEPAEYEPRDYEPQEYEPKEYRFDE
jgi:hypothetical protein